VFSRVGLVEALDLRNGKLTLRSRKQLALGSRTQVRVQLPPGTGKLVTVPIVIESEQALQGGGFLYRAVVDTELPEQLEFQGDDPVLRQGRRVEVNIRARARELPEFRAIVTDFSRGGCQLKLCGPIKRGLRFVLNLDLEGFRLDTLAVPVEVTRVSSTEHHECGVRFLARDGAQEKDLTDLANFVEERAGSGLQKLLNQARLADPAPVTARPIAVVAPPVVQPPPTNEMLLLPVKARLDGYTRNLTSGSLYVRFVASDEVIHTLEFPACRWLEDLETSRCAEVARLRCQTLATDEAERYGPGDWRHYAFLADDGEVLLELISRHLKA